MSRHASALSPRGEDRSTDPADRTSDHRQHAGEGSSDAESQLADLVGRDLSALSIDQLIPDDSHLRDLLRSSNFDDVDIQRIVEFL